MGLARYIALRLGQMIFVLAVVVVLSFGLVRLAPGDPAQILAGPAATSEYLAEVRGRYGLDEPILTQFREYVSQLAHGDLGRSFSVGEPVVSVIADRLPATLLLVVTGQVLGLVLGTALGTLAARAQHSALDRGLSVFALAANSMPVFWLGMLFILLFSVKLKVLPSSGMHDVFAERGGWAGFLDLVEHLVLPLSTLTLAWTMPTYLRLARAAVIDASRQEYVTTARAKGASETTVFFRHALRNALLPLVTVVGLYFGLAISGAVLTETLFAWPGVGQAMYQSILSRDYPLLMGIFLTSSVAVLVMSLVTDLLYAFIDPRVTYS